MEPLFWCVSMLLVAPWQIAVRREGESPLHAVRVWKTHTPSPQVMQLDHTSEELLWRSNLGCIFEVDGHKNKATVWAIPKGGDDIFTIIGVLSISHINVEPYRSLFLCKKKTNNVNIKYLAIIVLNIVWIQ